MKSNHIQVNDKRLRTGDSASKLSIKCPLGLVVLEKGEITLKNNQGTDAISKKRAAYSQ